MATRTRNTSKQTQAKTTAAKPTAKKAAGTPRKPAAKKALPKAAPVNTATVVDLRRPLPVRRRVFVGPSLTVHEQATARAILAAARAQLPVSAWLWDGPTARLKDGTLLLHTQPHGYTDQQHTFKVAIRCPHGAVHVHTIHTAQELDHARALTSQCTQRTSKAPEPAAPDPAERVLGDALVHSTSSADETQPLPKAEIAAGLAARADNETPKGHPEP